MSKLEEFLLSDKMENTGSVEVSISSRFPFPFKVHAITEAENKATRKSCQTVSINKTTHQKQTDTNYDLYLARLVCACTEDPNFKSAELQAKFGVIGAEALIDKLLLPGEYNTLLSAVQEINGFSEDINELKEEAKN